MDPPAPTTDTAPRLTADQRLYVRAASHVLRHPTPADWQRVASTIGADPSRVHDQWARQRQRNRQTALVDPHCSSIGGQYTFKGNGQPPPLKRTKS